MVGGHVVDGVRRGDAGVVSDAWDFNAIEEVFNSKRMPFAVRRIGPEVAVGAADLYDGGIGAVDGDGGRVSVALGFCVTISVVVTPEDWLCSAGEGDWSPAEN